MTVTKAGEGDGSRTGQETLSSVLRELSFRFWRLLRSRNLAIAMMAIIAVLIIAALTLPQPDQVGPRAYGQWKAANPFLAQAVESIGLDHLFSTWWFLIIAALLYLNTLACTVTQVRGGLAKALARPRFPSLGFLQAARHHMQVVTPGSCAAAVGAVRQVFQDHGYGIVLSEVDDLATGSSNGRVYAEKGKLGVLGSPVLHVGLVIVFSAVAWSGLTRFSGYTEAGEGQTFSDVSGAYIQSSEGPLSSASHSGFSLRVDKIEEEKPVALGRVVNLSAKSFVTFLEGDSEAATATLEVNKSLAYRGVRVYQTQLFGPAVVFLLEYPDGKASQGMLNLTGGDGATFSNGARLPGTVYYADVALDANDNSLNIDVSQAKESLFSGPMKPGDKLRFSDGVALTLVDIRSWTGLRVVGDSSELLLYAGFFVTVTGLIICTLAIRRQVWVVLEGKNGHTTLFCAGLAAKNASMFAEEFGEIGESLRLLARPDPLQANNRAKELYKK